MRLMIGGVMIGPVLLGVWCAPASADGGALCFSGKRGAYQISVFTAPTPFRAGPVDISTLVQDAETGNPMTGVHVTVRIIKSGTIALEYPATSEAATNKLFRTARFELPEPGRWRMQVQVDDSHGPAVIGGEVEAAEPVPRWQKMWPWIGWPAVPIALFGIHLVLERHRNRPRFERGGQS